MFSAMSLLRSVFVRSLFAAKLSSTKKMWAFLDATFFISSITLSMDLKRYFLPNICITEQNLQPNGQPLDVAIGITVLFFQLWTKFKSGIGAESKSWIRGLSGLWIKASPSV